MRRFYYYIPPCPACGSRCTGRIIREPAVDAEYVEEESLKNGEIVRFARSEPIENAFCVDCDYHWAYTPVARFWTAERIEEEIEARGTREAYEELRRMNRAAAEEKKASARFMGFIKKRRGE